MKLNVFEKLKYHWCAPCSPRQGTRLCGVDGCTPVRQLMDETSNTSLDKMNLIYWLSHVTV